MTSQEMDVVLKLFSFISKSCYDPEILRKYGVLGDKEKYKVWKNAMFFLTEFLEEVLDGKKTLPTIEEAYRMLEKSQNQHKKYLEYLENKIKEEKKQKDEDNI
jgi:hypothetical protein